MRHAMALILFVALTVGAGTGCAHFLGERIDPQTHETTRVLTPAGEAAVSAAANVGKAVAGPLGVPPGAIELGIAFILGGLGVESTRRVANKVRKSEPGKLVG